MNKHLSDFYVHDIEELHVDCSYQRKKQLLIESNFNLSVSSEDEENSLCTSTIWSVAGIYTKETTACHM